MTKSEIIKEIKDKNFFDIRELVCKHTYDKFGDKSWQFFDTDALHMLLILRRDVFKSPMYINGWMYGKRFTQRGYRCNICSIPKKKTLLNRIYLSAHCNGAGFDCDVKGLTAEQARRKIEENQSLLPCSIRVEGKVNWLHFDIYDQGKGIMFYEFNV